VPHVLWHNHSIRDLQVANSLNMSRYLPSLLLLSPPPSPTTPAALSAAYRPSITAAVSVLKVLETSTQLFVVLPAPKLHGLLSAPRSQIYDEVQQLVGGVYSLICMVCAKLGADVDSDTPGSIDARVLLLNYDSAQTPDESFALEAFVAGPIIDLPTLALSRRRWNLIFSVDGEEGQKLLSTYSDFTNQTSPPLQGKITLISGGVTMIRTGTLSTPSSTSSRKAHHVVAVGGTFDHIHAGHKLLLTAATLLLQPASGRTPTMRRLIVGLTGDELLKNKKYAEYLKSWKQRQDDVIDFLMSILSFTKSSSTEAVNIFTRDEPGPNGRAIHTTLKASLITIECVEIQDPFGPTITDASITALVVSGETRSGGQAVNDERKQKGWDPLEVFEVDVLDAEEHEEGTTKTEEFASKISSTSIRKRKAENARTSSL